MPNDPLRDSPRHTPEETSDYSSQPEAPMQRRREREGAQRAPKQAVSKLFVLDTNVLMHDPT